MIKGLAGFVLPKFNDSCYITIEPGDNFGDLDLLPTDSDTRRGLSLELSRKFTV